MKCKEVRNLLVPYLDGEVSRKEREEISKHLSSCKHCREEAETVASLQRKTSYAFRATVGERSCPNQVWWGIQQRLISRERPQVALPDTTKSKLKGGVETMRRFFSWRPVWKPALVGVVTIALIVSLALIIPSHVSQAPEVLATEIAKKSPEVQAALDGEPIYKVMVVRVVDDTAFVYCGTMTGAASAAHIDLEKMKVTEVKRIQFDLTEEQKAKAIEITKADPKVQELLSKGATIDKAFAGILGMSSNENDETEVTFYDVRVAMTLDNERYTAVVDLEKGEAQEIYGPKGKVIKMTGAVKPLPATPPPPVTDSSTGPVLLAVMPNAPFYTPADFKGVKIGLCLGSDLNMLRVALDTYDIAYFTIFLPPNELLLALQRGVIDAALVTEHPWDVLEAEDFQTELRFLPWSTQAIEAVKKQFPGATATQLPANTYPWQSESVPGYSS